MSAPPSGKSPRRKLLTSEDEEIWRAVTRTLKPLTKPRVRVAAPAPIVEKPSSAPARARPKAAAPTFTPAPPAKPTRPNMQPIEDKLRRKLARGSLRADMKIDLHGMRQHEAHEALLSFLWRARAQGAKVVIVVTGKGRGSRSEDGHVHQAGGVLQRMVRHWLAAPDLRDHVIGFDEADAAHGGSGALYVRVRRDRSLGGRDE